jgi:hypothetical protein
MLFFSRGFLVAAGFGIASTMESTPSYKSFGRAPDLYSPRYLHPPKTASKIVELIYAWSRFEGYLHLKKLVSPIKTTTSKAENSKVGSSMIPGPYQRGQESHNVIQASETSTCA